MKRAKPKSELGQYLYSILTVVGLFLVIRTSVVQAFYIPSSSMEDTLLVGDYLLGQQVCLRRSGRCAPDEHFPLPPARAQGTAAG